MPQKTKIKVFKRGASYAAREKGAKRGSKRDKRDAVTPAAGSGGQGDQAGDRATLRDRVGRRAGSLSRVHPTRLTQRCMAEASEAPKAEACDVSTEKGHCRWPSRNRHASQTGGSAGAFRWRKEKPNRRATSRPRAMETERVPSQLVIEVGFEGGVWRQASTTGGRPESYRAEVQARA